ncbi:MAG: hypothetical protein CXX73_02920 [Methanobacteriota archaeon]|nr:MAG: hypothetical protein CXX73_02920 [Euryarchaeota archaeon]
MMSKDSEAELSRRRSVSAPRSNERPSARFNCVSMNMRARLEVIISRPAESLFGGSLADASSASRAIIAAV